MTPDWLQDRVRSSASRRWLACGVAATSATIAYLLVWALQGGNPRVPLYPFFTLAIIGSALTGGFWPGMLALGLSLIYTVFFTYRGLAPLSDHGALLALVAFAGVGASVSAISAVLRHNRRALNQRNAELEAERARWQGVVEGIAEEVWVCDAQGKISLVNLPHVTAMGLNAFKDRSIEHVLAEVDILNPDGNPRPAEDAPLLRSLRGEVVRGEETMRHRTTGITRHRQFSSAPTRDGSGAITGAVAIVRDITDLKYAQEALIRSEKLAAVGRMAATISHEVNNPLAAATNAVYLASIDPTLNTETSRVLAIADQELRRAAHISRQTLGFFREHTTTSPVALPKLFDEILSVYGRKLQERGISIQRRYKCGSCRDGCEACFLTNIGELRQVISNLLANALDALANQGTLHIRVTRLPRLGSETGPVIQLTIADNGCGIRTEHLKRIFEPFFTTKQSTGTGLGLWVTQELVRKHKGSIRVRSRAGQGTVFRISFPALPAAAPAPISNPAGAA